VCRDSLVVIATRYGLGGPGIESRWGARVSATVQTGPGAHPASYIMGTGSFPGVKRPWRGVDHPPPPSAEVEGRVELYIYSPSGPSWPVLGRTQPLLSLSLLSIYPSIHPFIHPSIHLSIYLSIHLSIYIYLYIHTHTHTHTHIPVFAE